MRRRTPATAFCIALLVCAPSSAEDVPSWTRGAAEHRRLALTEAVAGASSAGDREAAIDAVTRDVVDAFWPGRAWGGNVSLPKPTILAEGPPAVSVMPLSILKDTQAAFSSIELMDDLAKAQPGTDDVVVQIVSGRADAASLDAALEKVGRGDLLEIDGPAARLSAPLLVAFGAAFVAESGTTLVLDSSKGVFLGNSGTLVVDGASIEGTEASAAGVGASFRSFVLSTGRVLSIDGASLRRLGYPGVYTAGLSVAQSSGRAAVSNSSFEDVLGVRVHQSSNVAAAGNRFVGSSATQMTVSASERVSLRDNVFWGAAANGLSLTDRSSDVDVVGNVFVGNRAAGVAVAGGSDAVRIRDNAVYGNAGPGIGVYGAGCVEAISNLVLANGKDGVSVRRPKNTVVEDNRILMNGWNGVSVAKAVPGGTPSVRVSGNLVSMNRVGIAADDGRSVTLGENEFRMQSPRVYGDALQGFGAVRPVPTATAQAPLGCAASPRT